MNTPQNIYDNPDFFGGYKKLREQDSGLNGVLEIPALRATLPPLKGLAILDMGCGFGDFARYARQQGAASVLGIDVSQNMLDAAQKLTGDNAITYRHMAIEAFHVPIEGLEPGHNAFDLVVSSLALHYVQDYAGVARRVFAALRPGGTFVFTVEHPIMTANPRQDWFCDANGNRLHFPLVGYSHEGQRNTSWFVDDVIKFHRTTATYVNTLLDTGFRLLRLEEPTPLPEALAVRDDLKWQLERPPFLLLAAAKPA